MKTPKELRVEKNLKQEELANVMSVNPRTVQNIEKNPGAISDSLLLKYLIAFNISYDEIFLGDEYEKNVFENRNKKEIQDLMINRLKNKQEA